MYKFNKQLNLLLAVLLSLRTSQSAPTLEALLDDPSIRMTGGVPASRDEFPYIVSIQAVGESSVSHLCGGTIIDMSYVVTAAHCVENWRESELVVVAGAYYQREARQGIQQLSNVKLGGIKKYPGNTATSHDLAILELSIPFEPTTSVAALSLPRKEQLTTGKCVIIGWGHTEHNNEFTDELRKGNITVNPKDACAAQFPDLFDRDYQVCVGRMGGENVSPCWGDNGGPLICNHIDGSQYFAGVMSWGPDCRTPYPTVCMEIAKYREWIDSNTRKGDVESLNISQNNEFRRKGCEND